MTLKLARGFAPLLMTTMLVAVPAFAQTNGSSPAPLPGTSSATTPPAGTNQTQTSQGAGPSGTSQKAMPHSSRSAMARQQGETMQGVAERRITEMHNRLHITPQQSQQWDQFAQVVRDNAQQMDQIYRQRASQLSSMSAVDNMQSFAQIEQERAQQVQKLVPAFQTLYSSLSDQQKQSADAMFRNMAARAQTHHEGTSG